jgi:hypothetical protein
MATAMPAAHDAAPRLTGDPLPTPWDPDLATAMAHHDVRVEEELFLDVLLADLASSGS